MAADEERKRYTEEIYKNFLYEIEHNLKIEALRAPMTGLNIETPYRVSYFQSIQNDLDYVSQKVRDEMRNLYSRLEEINLYINKINQVGREAFFSQYRPKSDELIPLVTPIREMLLKAQRIIKEELEKLVVLS